MNRPVFHLEHFRKATKSADPPQCVHIARGLGWALIRDTKQEDGSRTDYRLAFRTEQFDELQAAIREHNLRTAEIPAHALAGLAVSITRVAQDVNVLCSTVEQPGLGKGAALVFTDGEIAAFFDGVHKREFDADGDYVPHSEDCAADCAESSHVVMAAAV